jgi:hypothetical protein
MPIAIPPSSRTTDLEVSTSFRATAGILNDLVEGGYLVKEKVGRNNRYTVHGELAMRHPLNERASVADLLSLFG